MGFWKNLMDKIKGKPKALPEAQYVREATTNIQFLSADGMSTYVNGIESIQQFTHRDGSYTTLYKAGLIKGVDHKGRACENKICFELPSDIDYEYAINQMLPQLVSNQYYDRNTKIKQGIQTYEHIGRAYLDKNYKIQSIQASERVKDYVERTINNPIRMQYFAYQAEKENQELNNSHDLKKQIANNKIEAYNSRVNDLNDKWNNAIFEERKDQYGNKEYTLYTQETDFNARSGYSTLQNLSYMQGFKHSDGTVGYVYSANVFNHYEAAGTQDFAKVYPKVAFELPYSIEELKQRMQNGDKDAVRYLGVLLSNKNLNNKQVTTDGKATWIGQVKQDLKGNIGVDYNASKTISEYIDNENAKVDIMNSYGRNPQQPSRNFQTPQEYDK